MKTENLANELEKLVCAVQNGECQNVIVIGLDEDGQSTTLISVVDGLYTMIAALEIAKLELLQRVGGIGTDYSPSCN